MMLNTIVAQFYIIQRLFLAKMLRIHMAKIYACYNEGVVRLLSGDKLAFQTPSGLNLDILPSPLPLAVRNTRISIA